MSEGNGAPAPVVGSDLPVKAGRLSHLVTILRQDGRAEGWAAVRDLLFDRYEVLKKEVPTATLIKLAIDLDKHALFCEMAADKGRLGKDQDAYAWFQSYLRGERDDAPVAGSSGVVSAPLLPVMQDTDDDEEDDDGEGPNARE